MDRLGGMETPNTKMSMRMYCCIDEKPLQRVMIGQRYRVVCSGHYKRVRTYPLNVIDSATQGEQIGWIWTIWMEFPYLENRWI